MFLLASESQQRSREQEQRNYGQRAKQSVREPQRRFFRDRETDLVANRIIVCGYCVNRNVTEHLHHHRVLCVYCKIALLVCADGEYINPFVFGDALCAYLVSGRDEGYWDGEC